MYLCTKIFTMNRSLRCLPIVRHQASTLNDTSWKTLAAQAKMATEMVPRLSQKKMLSLGQFVRLTIANCAIHMGSNSAVALSRAGQHVWFTYLLVKSSGLLRTQPCLEGRLKCKTSKIREIAGRTTTHRLLIGAVAMRREKRTDRNYWSQKGWRKCHGLPIKWTWKDLAALRSPHLEPRSRERSKEVQVSKTQADPHSFRNSWLVAK